METISGLFAVRRDTDPRRIARMSVPTPRERRRTRSNGPGMPETGGAHSRRTLILLKLLVYF